MKNFNNILVLLFLAISSALLGQIEVNQVEVVKQFEAELEDAEKINIQPILTIPKIEKRQYKYDVTIVPLSLKYPEPIIKPLAMKKDDPIDVSNFYFKGGYGNLSNPLVKFRWATHGDDMYEINAHVDYYALDNAKKVDLQEMSDLNLGLDVKYRLKDNLQLKVGTDVDLSKRFFYFTYYDKSLATLDQLRRNTNDISIYGGIENIEPINDRLDYTVGANLAFINTTNFKANEQLLTVNGNLRYRISSSLYASVPLEVNTVRYDVIDVADAQANFIADINPHIVFHKGKLNASVGIELLHDKETNRIWPTANLSYSVVGKELQVFAGTDQKKVINDLKNILEFAPWANSRFRTLNVNTAREFYGGVRGNFTFINYEGRVGYRQNTNQTLFTNYRVIDLESSDKLSIDYTSMNTVFINGNIDFEVSNILTVGGAIIKNFYEPELAESAYGLLGLEVNGWGKLKLLNDKLLVRSDLYLADRSVSLFPNINNLPQTVRGTNLFDLNFGVEIWPISKVAIFADAFNVLNNQNVRWYGYPQVGIHFNAGAIVKF
jgi:hypothetical protein